MTKLVALHDLSMIKREDQRSRYEFSPRNHRENRIRSGRFPRLLAAAASLLMATGMVAADEAGTNGATADGDQLPVPYYRPLGESSRAVLIAAGVDESEEAWAPIADSLRRSGFHVLVVDVGRVEEQAASRATRRDRPDQRATRANPTAMDVQTALCYLRDLPGVTVRDVTLVGSGSGCSAVLGIHEIDFERFSLVFLSPSGGRRDRTDGRPAGLGVCPMLVIATTDDLLSLEASAAILREVPQQECWVVDARGRGVEILRSRPDLVSLVTAWILRSTGSAEEKP